MPKPPPSRPDLAAPRAGRLPGHPPCRRRSRSVAVALGLVALLDGTAHAATPIPPPTGAAPCWRAIERFDAIVGDPPDHQLLAIEAYELDQALRWRDQAEAACATGAYWFGLGDIEAALERIGAPSGPPLLGPDPPRERHSGRDIRKPP